MQWIFIGAGNMAMSLIGGLLQSAITPDAIAVADPNAEACSRAHTQYRIRAETTIQAVIESTHIDGSEQPPGIVLAVKPDVVQKVCCELHTVLNHYKEHASAWSNTLFVSVAAGVRSDSLEQWLPESSAVVRCMPNTPALLGLGTTVLHANTQCSALHRQQAEQLMQCAGKTFWVSDENLLDAVTAVSGSGPAYFFYFIEHMTQAGIDLGLDHSMAEALAIETVYGAASMMRQQDQSPAQLRENVTSKGGTTAAALRVFDEQNLPRIIHAALESAQKRAVELGDILADKQEQN